MGVAFKTGLKRAGFFMSASKVKTMFLAFVGWSLGQHNDGFFLSFWAKRRISYWLCKECFISARCVGRA